MIRFLVNGYARMTTRSGRSYMSTEPLTQQSNRQGLNNKDSRTVSKTELETTSSSPCVEHDFKNHVFLLNLAESEKAILEYSIEDNCVIDFYHTEVPISQRGKGIGKILVKEGLKYAMDSGFKVRPTCSYVDKYVSDNMNVLRGVDIVR